MRYGIQLFSLKTRKYEGIVALPLTHLIINAVCSALNKKLCAFLFYWKCSVGVCVCVCDFFVCVIGQVGYGT